MPEPRESPFVKPPEGSIKINDDTLTGEPLPWPGLLMVNDLLLHEKRGTLNWCQTIHRLDQKWVDGNPVLEYNSPAVTKKDGRTPIDFKGADCITLKEDYRKVVGVTMLPEGPNTGNFMEGAFMFKTEVRAIEIEGRDRPWYVRTHHPVEFLGGKGYVYEGDVTTRYPRDASEEKEQDAAATAAGDAAEEDNRKALAKILDGVQFSEYDANVISGQVDFTFVLGAPVKGGVYFNGTDNPVLVDRLVAAGLGTVAKGAFTCADPTPEDESGEGAGPEQNAPEIPTPTQDAEEAPAGKGKA